MKLVIIMGIRRQDRVTNQEVLDRAGSTSIEAMPLKAGLRWTGHAITMTDSRTPRQLLYGELMQGSRKQGRPKLRINSSIPSDFPALVHSLKDCIEDVAEWMCDSMLKMNHDKTELIAIGTKPKISQVTLSLTPVSIYGHNIPFSQSVRNLGVFRDEILSMGVHIKHLCRILFCQLRRLGKIPSSPLMRPTNLLFLSYSQD